MSSQPFESVSETAALRKCPTPRQERAQGSIAIGDLHGNGLRLLYALIREGVVDVKPGIDRKEMYSRFKEVYESAESLIQENFGTIAEVVIQKPKDRTSKLLGQDLGHNYKRCMTSLEFNLANWQVVNPHVLIRFMGNTLASAGACDGFTLALLGLLQTAGVRTVHYASPHDMAYVAAHKNGFKEIQDSIVKAAEKPSLLAWVFCLQRLSDYSFVKNTAQRFQALYLDRVSLLGYALNPDGGIVLFSHAPVPFTIIRALAQRFDVDYRESSARDLADTIDDINRGYRAFLQKASSKEIEEEFFDYQKADARANTFHKLLLKTMAYPIVASMQNGIPITPRECERDTTEQYHDWAQAYFTIPKHLAYPVYFVHGHARWPAKVRQPAHVFGMDTAFDTLNKVENRLRYPNPELDYTAFRHKVLSPFQKPYQMAQGILNAALVTSSALLGALVTGLSLYFFAPALLLAPFLGTILVGAVVGLCLGALAYCVVNPSRSKAEGSTAIKSAPVAVDYKASSSSLSESGKSLSTSSESSASRTPGFFKEPTSQSSGSSSSQIYDSSDDESTPGSNP